LAGQLAGVDKKLITDGTALLIAQSGAGTIDSDIDFSGTAVTASGLQAMLENLSAGRLAGSLTFNGMVLDPGLRKLDVSGKLADQEITPIVSAFLQRQARCCACDMLCASSIFSDTFSRLQLCCTESWSS
jgi:hypothetical protein